MRAATPARRAVTARGSPAFSPAPGMPRGRAWAWRGRRGAPACPSPSKVKSTAPAPRPSHPPALTEPRNRDSGPAACERAGGPCQRRCPSSRRSFPEPAPAPIYRAGPALRARLTRHVTAASPGPAPTSAQPPAAPGTLRPPPRRWGWAPCPGKRVSEAARPPILPIGASGERRGDEGGPKGLRPAWERFPWGRRRPKAAFQSLMDLCLEEGTTAPYFIHSETTD